MPFPPRVAVAGLLFLLLVITPTRAREGAREPVPVPDHPRYAIQHLGDEIGLGTATITALVQDPQGFLWVGTQNGLYRFDGIKANRFSSREGILHDRVNQLLVGPDGKLWAAVGTAIYWFDGLRFVTLQTPKNIELRQYVQTLAVTPQGDIFLATENGLLRMRPEKPSDYRLWSRENGLPMQHVTAVFSAPDGTVWFGAEGHLGIVRPLAQKPNILEISKVPADRLFAILQDGQGRVWIRTHDHLGYLDPSLTTYIGAGEGIPGANDFGMPSLDRSGNLLVPTVLGLDRRVENHWENVGEKQGLTTNAVYAALEDREGAIWVGLGGAGIDRWAGSLHWSGWGEAEGLPDAVVWCVARDSRKRLWAGTNNGLAMWDPGSRHWRVWKQKEGLAGTTVRDLAIAGDGAVWTLSIPGGLTRIDPNSLAATKITVPGSSDDAPATLTTGPDGNIWLGARAKLSFFRTENGKPVLHDIALPAAAVGKTQALSFAPDGTLWSSGHGGLARYDGKQWLTFTKADGLKEDALDLALGLNEQEAWLCYNESHGLTHVRMEDGKLSVRHFSMQDGLLSDSVYLLGRDSQGRIWAGGDRGIALLNDQGVITHFDRASGLLWDDVDEGFTWNDPDGSVLVATSRGLARYSPGGVVTRGKPPNVVITSAQIGGVQQLNNPGVEVPYSSRTLVVDFAAMTFHSPDYVRCQYRLDGLENDFLETNVREVRYPALPPGGYRFIVRCGSVVEGWSSTPAEFFFVIRPPWWALWWARLAALLAVGLIVRALVLYRFRSLEDDRLRLEQAVAERSAELARANAELQAMSLTDPLTKVRNRRFFRETIEADAMQVVRAYRRAGTNAGPIEHGDLILYFVDLDHFKRINDEYGHYAGDRVLMECAQRLSHVVRQSDLLIRWGGEEFLVVLRSGTRADGDILARRVLRLIGAAPFDIGDGKKVPMTGSIGWAAFPWITTQPDALSVDDVLVLADRAMYVAKEAGRNYAVGIGPSPLLLGSPASGPGAAIRVDELVPESDLVRLTRSLGSWIQAPTEAAQSVENEGSR